MAVAALATKHIKDTSLLLLYFFIYYFFRGKQRVQRGVEVVVNTEEGEAVVVAYWCHVYVTFFR